MPAGANEIQTPMSPSAPSDTVENVAAVAEGRLASTILEALLLQIPVGVVVADRTGAIMYANELGRSMLAGGSSPDNTAWPLARALLLGETVRGEELEVVSAEAGRRWVRVSAIPLRGVANRIDGALVIFADVTAERMAAAWRPAIESLQRL